MATQILHLPPLKNVQSGMNKYDQVHSAVYEVYFTLPESLKKTFERNITY